MLGKLWLRPPHKIFLIFLILHSLVTVLLGLYAYYILLLLFLPFVVRLYSRYIQKTSEDFTTIFKPFDYFVTANLFVWPMLFAPILLAIPVQYVMGPDGLPVLLKGLGFALWPEHEPGNSNMLLRPLCNLVAYNYPIILTPFAFLYFTALSFWGYKDKARTKLAIIGLWLTNLIIALAVLKLVFPAISGSRHFSILQLDHAIHLVSRGMISIGFEPKLYKCVHGFTNFL